MKKIVSAIVAIVILVVGIGFVASCTTKIPAGYAAVQYNIRGGISEHTLGQGWHLVSPMIETTLYSTGIEQSYLTADRKGDSQDNESFSASTSEGKEIIVELTFSYQFDADRLPEIFTRFKGRSGVQVRDVFIKPNVISWSKEVTARHKLAQIFGAERAEINGELSEYLKNKFEPYGINIINASLINIEVDEDTKAIINEKIAAVQIQETQNISNQTAIDKADADAKVSLTKAQAEADALLIEAQAKAEANTILSKSLTPELIESQKIDKWSGTVPVVQGSGATIIDVGDVVGEANGD